MADELAEDVELDEDGFEIEYETDEPDDDAIDAALQAIDEAQTLDEERIWAASDKMPCPECAGSGSVHGGALGDHCPKCGGMRVIAMPGSDTVNPIANWKALRRPWSEYQRARADRQLPASHACGLCAGTGRIGQGGGQCPDCLGAGSLERPRLALPAPSTLPAVEFLKDLKQRIRASAKQLGQGAMPQLAAPAPKKPTTLGGYTDAELDAMEGREGLEDDDHAADIAEAELADE